MSAVFWTDLPGRILDELERRESHAAFVTEVAASLRPGREDLEAALAALSRDRRVLITGHPAPDVHLESTDLRVIARMADPTDDFAAQQASNALWNHFLQQFFSTHRCQ